MTLRYMENFLRIAPKFSYAVLVAPLLPRHLGLRDQQSLLLHLNQLLQQPCEALLIWLLAALERQVAELRELAPAAGTAIVQQAVEHPDMPPRKGYVRAKVLQGGRIRVHGAVAALLALGEVQTDPGSAGSEFPNHM